MAASADAYKGVEGAVGSLASHVRCRAELCVALPPGLDSATGASLSTVFLTAIYGLVNLAGLQPGDTVLIHAGAGGVGQAALQVARRCGARILATARGPKQQGLLDQGVEAVFDSRSLTFAEQVRSHTGGKGVDLVVNNVGGTVFSECLRCMAFQGRLATVGYVDGSLKSDIDLEALHSQRLHLFGVSNKNRTPAQRAGTVQGFVRDILPAINDRRIRPLIDRVFGYAELPQAKQYMESNAQVGKIVISH
jgi:NADPH:quinone reductase-like Zn-dependent oxidoreductase